MSYLLLNPAFESDAVVDEYQSIIWTDRYTSHGDFELRVAASTNAINTYKDDYYLWSSESDRLMIVEGAEIENSEESGDFLIVTGRSLESILDRRIFWRKEWLRGSVQDAIFYCLDLCAIASAGTDRRIPGLRYIRSTDPKVTGLQLDYQVDLGANLYEVIANICDSFDLGFKITMPTEGDFVFELYNGIDRSSNQSVNDLVIFSPDFDNLKGSNVVKSKKISKTITLIGGEGEDAAKKTATLTVSSGAGTGLARREIYTDASGVSSKVNDQTIPDDVYTKQLQQKGAETLVANSVVFVFDGNIETLDTDRYNLDFKMGDIVQLENDYGIASTSRIVEFIRSKSPEGNLAYPSLKSIPY